MSVLFQSCKTDKKIGESYGGGFVANILVPVDPGYSTSKQHGLIVAPTDQGTGIVWWNGINMINSTATALGTGLFNTNAIIAAQGDGNYAAILCHKLNLGGNTDWYLPSKDELNKLYLCKSMNTIGGFAAEFYWSSV